MTDRPPGFFEGTGMPDPSWWEALWPDPAKVLTDVGAAPEMDVVDLCNRVEVSPYHYGIMALYLAGDRSNA